MAFSVIHSPPASLNRLVRRLSTRSFASSSIRCDDGPYHTYFPLGSPHVHFPQSSKLSRGAELFKRARSHSPRELIDSQKWMIFFGGFFTFPLVCLGYYYGDWAFGSKLWEHDIEELEERGISEGSRGGMKRSRDVSADFAQVHNVLQRANAETKALHDLVLLWINPEIGLHAAKDAAMLKSHPIKMSDGKELDLNKAILIRILDKDSETLVLLLGVDMSGHTTQEKDPALAWGHDDTLHRWMDDRAEDLKQRGEAAKQGISLYCYTATSSATSLPNNRGHSWQEARLFPEDLPSGFPLKALECVKNEMCERVT